MPGCSLGGHVDIPALDKSDLVQFPLVIVQDATASVKGVKVGKAGKAGRNKMGWSDGTHEK